MALLGRRKKKAATKQGPSRREKWAQIKVAFSMTRKADNKLLPLMLGGFVLTLALFVLIGVVTGHPIIGSIFGVMFSALVAAALFGRRVQRTAYAQVEGQRGAAAAVLQNMRGNWRVTPAVQFSKDQDMVHRVVGRPGVVLVGEGNPTRLRSLIGNERRALARIVGETPIYDVIVGDAEGQLALRDLEKHFMRLPRNIKPAVVNSLDTRLKAIRTAAGAMPVPKGPMPTRVPRGKVR
jgi:hypothetical protein